MESRHFEIKKAEDGSCFRKGFKFRKVVESQPQITEKKFEKTIGELEPTAPISLENSKQSKKRKSFEENSGQSLATSSETKKSGKKVYYPKVKYQMSHQIESFNPSIDDHKECLQLLLKDITKSELNALEFYFESNGRKTSTDSLFLALKSILSELPSSTMEELEDSETSSSSNIVLSPELPSTERRKQERLMKELKAMEKTSLELAQYQQTLEEEKIKDDRLVETKKEMSGEQTQDDDGGDQMKIILSRCETLLSLLSTLSSSLSSLTSSTEGCMETLYRARDHQHALFDLYSELMTQYQLHLPPSGEGPVQPLPLSYHPNPYPLDSSSFSTSSSSSPSPSYSTSSSGVVVEPRSAKEILKLMTKGK